MLGGQRKWVREFDFLEVFMIRKYSIIWNIDKKGKGKSGDNISTLQYVLRQMVSTTKNLTTKRTRYLDEERKERTKRKNEKKEH